MFKINTIIKLSALTSLFACVIQANAGTQSITTCGDFVCCKMSGGTYWTANSNNTNCSQLIEGASNATNCTSSTKTIIPGGYSASGNLSDCSAAS